MRTKTTTKKRADKKTDLKIKTFCKMLY